MPWVLWGGLVGDEVDDKRRLLQALNCLLIETPSGRVLVETGIGERVDDKTRAMRAYEGPWIVAALETAGFLPETVDVVAMSHLHFDHAGGLLRADGARAFPRATIVAQRAEWEVALGDNPRLVASYVQPELRLVERLGRAGLGRRRARDPAGRHRRADRRPLDRPPGGRRPGSGDGRADAGVLRRPADAAVGGQPALGHLVRRLPAGFGRPQGRAVRPGRRRGLDRRAVARGARTRSGGWCATATGSASSRTDRGVGRGRGVAGRVLRSSAGNVAQDAVVESFQASGTIAMVRDRPTSQSSLVDHRSRRRDGRPAATRRFADRDHLTRSAAGPDAGARRSATRLALGRRRSAAAGRIRSIWAAAAGFVERRRRRSSAMTPFGSMKTWVGSP